jgi:hypothetical protein
MTRLLAALLLASLAACGGESEPRYATITLTADAPTASLPGVTAGNTAALEIAPGCAGYVDADAPDHVLVVRDPLKLVVRAHSERGPVALLIERDDRFFCDSDQNTGHSPALQVVEPGRYAIRVAALGAPAALPYALDVKLDTKEREGETETAEGISVTVTSEPTGATVRTESGQVLGVTPAMFVLPKASDGGVPALIVELDGHGSRTVSGTPVHGELVLHAALAPPRPVEHEVAATQSPQPILDFRSATLSAEVTQQCAIAGIEADVALRHTYIGDLMIQLRSPAGRVATLQRYRGGGRHNLTRTWSSGDNRALERFRGEQATGTWQLIVRDQAELDSGYLDRFTLRVECATR